MINPALFGRVPYDPVNDFDPLSLAVTSTTIIVVNVELPVSNIKELVALIRANPGKLSYASAGAGTTSHLADEQFRLALAPDLVHVPFGGGAPAMASVVAGHTPVGMGTPTVVLPLVNDASCARSPSPARCGPSRCPRCRQAPDDLAVKKRDHVLRGSGRDHEADETVAFDIGITGLRHCGRRI